MSNQFYRYLAEKTISHFQENSLHSGDRFYVEFDTKAQAKEFYMELIRERNVVKLVLGEISYECYSLNISGIELLLTATSDDTTPDFLVTLRNKISSQENSWSNKAILFILSENLDSIRLGSMDLRIKNMPLNLDTIRSNIENEIEASVHSESHKAVLKFSLSRVGEDKYTKIALEDFEPILSCVQAGTILGDDWKYLGLFRDDGLDDFHNVDAVERRLSENFTLFSLFEDFIITGDKRELTYKFNDDFIEKIDRDYWMNNSYQTLLKSISSTSDQKKRLMFSEKLTSSTTGSEWYRVIKLKSNQYSIFIFNFDNLSEVSLVFDDILAYKTLDHNKLAGLDYRLENLSFVLNIENSNFYWIDINDSQYHNSRLKFNVVVFPTSKAYFERIISRINVDSKGRFLTLNGFDEIVFGTDTKYSEMVIVEDGSLFDLVSSGTYRLVFDENLRSYDNMNIIIRIDGTYEYKISLIDVETEKKTLLSLYELNNYIRTEEQSLKFDFARKTISGGDIHYSNISDRIVGLLRQESLFLTENSYFIENNEPKSLNIDKNLDNAFKDFKSFFIKNETLPSLVYFSPELVKLSSNYINEVIRILKTIEEGSSLSESQKNLKFLGTVVSESQTSFSPFHPLNVAYMLQLNATLGKDNVKEEILTKLSPDKFVPFILNDSDEVLESHSHQLTSSWLNYSPSRIYTSSERDLYTSSLVCEKLEQFVVHFKPLFIDHGKSPIIVNLINITNDFDVLKGIIKFIIRDIKKKQNFTNVMSISVNLYSNSESESAFEVISQLRSINEIDATFSSDIYKDIQNEISDVDSQDVLNLIYEKVNFYRFRDTGQYSYSHISFVNLRIDTGYIANQMTDFDNGSQLSGLISTLSNISNSNDFRVGFGSRLIPEMKLLELSALINEFSYNLNKKGLSAYQKNRVITLRISSNQLSMLKNIYEKSHWVTFINPPVDIDYFKKSYPELLVIHYADQITSFKKFDSITLTNKTKQYKHVLKNYLSKFSKVFEEAQLSNAINSFNCINGEWLLRSLKRNESAHSFYGKEKLSLISGVKYMLAILHTPNYLWIPVSLEEIIRVAGIAKLDSLSSAFSVKSLEVTGQISDDLLFMGILVSNENIRITMYPVEVKIGENSSGVIKKAKEQVEKLYLVLEKFILNASNFDKIYYLNLFVQIAISNGQMMNSSDFWPENKIDLSDKLKKMLIEGNIIIDKSLEKYIGRGAVLSFKKSLSHKSVYIEENFMSINLTEDDGIEGIYRSISEIRNTMISSHSDVNHESLLESKLKKETSEDNGAMHYVNSDSTQLQLGVSNAMQNSRQKTEYEMESKIETLDSQTVLVKKQEVELLGTTQSERIVGKSPEKESNYDPKNYVGSRILVGTSKTTRNPVYWEYGHKGLPNRHLLISGTSGQGKTYLIQCLLLEMSKIGVSSVVFDYTQGFTEDKLEEGFKLKLKDRLNQQIVLYEKFPINPFQKQTIDLGSRKMEETSTLVAQRIAEIFTHVYSFGEQQSSALYKACKTGIDKYGERMTMSRLEGELIDSDIKESKTVLSKLQPFFDMDFFSGDVGINWSEWIYNDFGKVNIIQLLSIPSDMQVALTELILWDLWYYAQKEGKETRPFVAIMDEAQNLSFSNGSPAAKILTEGRKFGWSAWFATQFLKGQIKTDGISRIQQAAQKIYFQPPENETSDVASRISSGLIERKQIEGQLKSLEKGKCLFDGHQIVNDKLINTKPIIVNVSSLKERED